MTLSWLSTALDALVTSNEVRAATLEAAVPAFCAGADLKERAEMDPDGMSTHSQLISTCAGKGPALGVGWNWPWRAICESLQPMRRSDFRKWHLASFRAQAARSG